MIASITFSGIVLAIHVISVVVAFGVLFAYPIVTGYVERNQPRALPALYGAMVPVARMVTAPAATLALVCGIYLASHLHVWSKVWVSVPLLVLLVVMGIEGALLIPRRKKAADLSARDIEASTDGTVRFSTEMIGLRDQIFRLGLLDSALIVVAILFMVVGPTA